MRIRKVNRSPWKGSAAALVADRFRQIHLDFHTSELIPDVGVGFDAPAFAETLADARVNWITLFAKCHHGLSYYPTRVGTVHPALKFDLLGAQIEACRSRGIVTPAYISVRVDENNARRHQEWIGRLKDGKVWKWGETLAPGWFQLCMNTPDYVEELGAQALEVLKWYDVEGIFFDMCYNPDPGCYCPRCYDAMKARGLDFTSDADHRRFEYEMTREYTKKLARIIRGVKKNATIFFNGRMRPDIGGELDVFTHVEIEALPTGGWGYSFFPIHARYGRVLGKPLQGMTARFHKSWADFGGLKTEDQLLYEAGTILAAGAVMNVGDQCHPRGILDQGAYQVIGTAFRHVEACEPWCRGASPASEIGVMMLPASAETGSEAASGNHALSPSVDGAGRMMLELKQQFDLIYPGTKLSKYKVVILPDSGYLGPATRNALAAFVAKGGAILASYKATLQNGVFACPGLPVKFVEDNPYKPSYLDLGPVLGKDEPASQFVFYEDSARVKASSGAQTQGWLVDSYFNRAFDRFCSHNQTPFTERSSYPIAVLKGRVAYLAPAVFKAYREHSYYLYKTIVGRLLEELLPEPLVRVEAPSAMEVSVNRQSKPSRLIAHLVNFQPQRRHVNIEWIEKLYPVRDIRLALRTGKAPREVRLVPQDKPISFRQNNAYCEVNIPEVLAHQMIVFEL